MLQVAGPLIDIIQMFLTALFNVQDEEASQYKTVVESSSGKEICFFYNHILICLLCIYV